jgi:hypothetical protein
MTCAGIGEKSPFPEWKIYSSRILEDPYTYTMKIHVKAELLLIHWLLYCRHSGRVVVWAAGYEYERKPRIFFERAQQDLFA